MSARLFDEIENLLHRVRGCRCGYGNDRRPGLEILGRGLQGLGDIRCSSRAHDVAKADLDVLIRHGPSRRAYRSAQLVDPLSNLLSVDAYWAPSVPQPSHSLGIFRRHLQTHQQRYAGLFGPRQAVGVPQL
jgi:hypothetical protein